MKTAFVTGGTGHTGNYLVTKLLDLGWHVKTLVYQESEDTKRYLQNTNVEIINGDILDKDLLQNSIRSSDVVFHLASLISIGGIKTSQVYAVNLDGTKNIVDVCIQKKVRKLIYVSSIDIIDYKASDVLVEPNKKIDGRTWYGDYIKSKGLAFNYVMDKIAEGLKCSICIPATFIGPGDYLKSHLGKVVLNVINNKMNYAVRGELNLIDVRDVTEGIYATYKKGRLGEAYLLSNKVVTVADFVKTIKICLNRKPTLHIIPTRFLKCIAPFSEFFCKLLHVTPVITRCSVKAMSFNTNFSNKKAKRELGWTPKYSIKESIKDAICWFADNKPEWIAKKYLKKIKV